VLSGDSRAGVPWRAGTRRSGWRWRLSRIAFSSRTISKPCGGTLAIFFRLASVKRHPVSSEGSAAPFFSQLPIPPQTKRAGKRLRPPGVWMGEHEYDSIKQMQGSMSRNAVPQPEAFERANYLKVLRSYSMR
jgi:hypothetical protein